MLLSEDLFFIFFVPFFPLFRFILRLCFYCLFSLDPLLWIGAVWFGFLYLIFWCSFFIWIREKPTPRTNERQRTENRNCYSSCSNFYQLFPTFPVNCFLFLLLRIDWVKESVTSVCVLCVVCCSNSSKCASNILNTRRKNKFVYFIPHHFTQFIWLYMYDPI